MSFGIYWNIKVFFCKQIILNAGIKYGGVVLCLFYVILGTFLDHDGRSENDGGVPEMIVYFHKKISSKVKVYKVCKV